METTVFFLNEKINICSDLPLLVSTIHTFDKYAERLYREVVNQAKCKKYYGNADEDFEHWKRPIEDIAEKVIAKASENGIYDLTMNELVYDNPGYSELYKVCESTINKILANLINEMKEYRNAMDRESSIAASKVTGSGWSVWTNSALNAMWFSALETSTIRKQANKADKEYREAMKAFDKQNSSRSNREENRILTQEYYPGCNSAIATVMSYMLDIYLKRLDTVDILNYNDIRLYSVSDSQELLKNIKIVPKSEIKNVLITAFKKCPYNADIYKCIIDNSLIDFETFKTAKYLCQAEILLPYIESKGYELVRKNEDISEIIKILAEYQNKNELVVLKKFYENTINIIKNSYHEIFLLCIDSYKLSTWIRDNISIDLDEIGSTTEEKIRDKVNTWIKRTVDDKQYEKLSVMGLISIDDIKYKDSTKTTLAEVQMEYADKMIALILDYIKELRDRKAAYEKAYDKYNAGLRKHTDAIAAKNDELKQQGLFAFSKKKKIKEELEILNKEYEEYRNTEPVDVKNAYFNM